MPSAPIRPWVIVTCKGRLDFLKRTALHLLSQGVHYCLVDYDCPQHSALWLREFSASTRPKGQVVAVRYEPAPHFHKTHAQNLGAREAISLGATHLMFSDADTLHASGSVEAVLALLSARTFVIAGRDAQDRPIRSLTGFIGLSVQDFEEAGGYDESFSGWGAEDIEFRLRLHLKHGLAFREVHHNYLEPMAHTDALRTEFQKEKDLAESNFRNNQALERKLEAWTQKRFEELVAPASRLLHGQLRRRTSAATNGSPQNA